MLTCRDHTQIRGVATFMYIIIVLTCPKAHQRHAQTRGRDGLVSIVPPRYSFQVVSLSRPGELSEHADVGFYVLEGHDCGQHLHASRSGEVRVGKRLGRVCAKLK